MGEKEFIELCRKRIAKYYGIDDYKSEDIYVVWLCKIIQNNKALLSTHRPDGLYFECTYNGDTHELYLDVYMQKDHFEIKPYDAFRKFDDELHKIDSDLYLVFYQNKPESVQIKGKYGGSNDLYEFDKARFNSIGVADFLRNHDNDTFNKLQDLINKFEGKQK